MKIRAHHLLCLVHKEVPNGWYNQNLKRHACNMRNKLIKNPNSKVKVIKKCDDICKKCPHIKNGICKKRKNINYWIGIMDNKVLKKIKIKENSEHKPGFLFELVINKIKNRDLRDICKGCEFLKLCLRYGIHKSIKQSKDGWQSHKPDYAVLKSQRHPHSSSRQPLHNN